MEVFFRDLLLWRCIYFIAVFTLVASSTEEPRHGQFTAELMGSELVVGTICKSSWTWSEDGPCQHDPGTVSPFVQLTTCTQSTSDDGGEAVLSTSRTLVTHLSHRDNCTNGGCHWKLGLDERFLASPCLDVRVADFTTSLPPLKGIRRRIWVQPDNQTELDLECEAADQCEILDRDTFEQRVVVALLLKDGLYYFRHSSEEANQTVELPWCLHEAGLLEWTTVHQMPCLTTCRTFTPSRVYAVSSTVSFITGNNSALYSPCRGCMWYQLLLPPAHSITSFASISSIFHALLTNNDVGEAGLWLGISGRPSVLRIFPTGSNLGWLFAESTEALNSFLTSASLTVTSQGNLAATSGSDELQLPLSLLLSHALNTHRLATLAATLNITSTLISSLQLLPDEDSLSLADAPHSLLNIHRSSHVCIFRELLVEAPVCGRVTRSAVEIQREGFLGFVDHGSLSWVDCSVMEGHLPTDVFLRLGESYTFTVHLVINPVIVAQVMMDQLTIVPSLSRPDAVQVETEGVFHTNNNTLTYQISLVERNSSGTQTQVSPATVLRSVDVDLQVGGIGMECIDPFDPHPNLMGRLHTRVHVGCPPGLSLVFDDIITQSHDNQFCTPSANVSCYYFGNEFHPVFELVDSVTGDRSEYTGPYTLRVLAGGTGLSDMNTFKHWQNVETQVWTASAEDVLSYTNNKIEWGCGLGSPCSEIVPSAGRSPEYYLHLQASNRVVGQHETYCDLTVEFTIRLHGMSMGPISTSITLILLLVLLVAPLLSLFPVWLWRERRGEGGSREGGGWRWGVKVVTSGREMVDYMRRWLEEIVRKYQQTRPIEPHLHTD